MYSLSRSADVISKPNRGVPPVARAYCFINASYCTPRTTKSVTPLSDSMSRRVRSIRGACITVFPRCTALPEIQDSFGPSTWQTPGHTTLSWRRRERHTQTGGSGLCPDQIYITCSALIRAICEEYVGMRSFCCTAIQLIQSIFYPLSHSTAGGPLHRFCILCMNIEAGLKRACSHGDDGQTGDC